MKLYNPYRENRPSKGVNYFIGASVWEALRHNSNFCKSVQQWKSAPDEIFTDNKVTEAVAKNSYLGIFAAIYAVDASALAVVPQYEFDSEVESPSLEIPWTDAPQSFKSAFSKMCMLFLGEDYRSQYGHLKADLSLGERLHKLCFEDNSAPDEILKKIKALLLLRKDYIFSLPIGKYSASKISEILIPVEKQFKNLSKSHGNKNILPKEKDWDCFITNKEFLEEGRTPSQAYSMVLYRHDRQKWVNFVDEDCNIELPDDPEEVFPHADQGFKACKTENRMPLMKNVENVKTFSNWLWPGA